MLRERKFFKAEKNDSEIFFGIGLNRKSIRRYQRTYHHEHHDNVVAFVYGEIAVFIPRFYLEDLTPGNLKRDINELVESHGYSLKNDLGGAD